MKIIVAFLRLSRWPNLFFIALTQCLFFFCVIHSIASHSFNWFQSYFFLLVAASLSIAAAGYIINDYFDLHIDAINKPGKVVIDKLVKRRWAILWHFVLSLAGAFLSVYFTIKTNNWIIAAGNISCIGLLWFYSTTFKKKLLIGNVIIAALSAWVMLVLYFAYCYPGAAFGNQLSDTGSYKQAYKFTSLYAGFAFIVSLIREVIKDLEDMEGDARHQCKTMPVVWGVPATKVFTAVWIVVCLAALFIISIYAWQLGWKLSVLYCFILIIAPLFFILFNLNKASSPAAYHKLSIQVKLVMLSGILSMVFFINR
ncbi:MAG: geranylgeranylglycerol-phosphate geranylgeranyltransferase [Ferruginibacter sp.]